jgi:DNA-binding CsgD family transcriptional regulator
MARILCPVLVGRRVEQASLEVALDAAQRGGGGVVFVSGPAGIGKSRLAAETAAQAEARRMTVLLGRCVPSKVPVPYRPVAEALVAASHGGPVPALESAELSGFRAALGWMVPAWRDQSAGAVAVESPVVVAEALLRMLQAIAGQTGCVLLVEDLQWADPETLHAVEYLADHARDSRVLCVCTLRDDASSDAAELLSRLDARRACDVVRVTPLDGEGVVEMAMRTLDTGALAPEIAAFLRDNAEGTPFLVEELLAAAVDGGSLVATSDGWRVSAPIRRLVPQSFATTVRARLDGLAPASRRFLGAAALLGRSFDWRIASRAADCAPGDAHAVLEHAVALQLLAAHGEGFSFRHALTREAILDELLPSERVDLAARCLDVLDAAGAPGEDWRHLGADLAEIAGDADRAAAYLLHAGRASLARGALDSATAALQRAAGIAVDMAVCADVLEALAEAQSAAGDLRSTRAAVESLVESLTRIDAPAGRRGHAHLLVARCAVTATRFGLASEELARARRLATSSGDAALAAEVGAVAAQLAIGEGRPDEAEALAVRAAADAAASGLPDVACEALEVASRCARTRDLDEARDISARALQVAEDAGLALWRMRTLYQLGVVEMFRSGEMETLWRAREAAERLGALATVTHLDMEMGAGLEAAFRDDESRQACTRCIEMARLLELHTVEGLAHAFIAVVEGRRGTRAAMEESIARATALAGDDPELVAALWGDARAVASLAAEDRARARSELEQAVALYTSPSAAVPRLAAALLPLVAAVDGVEPDFSLATGVTLLNAQCAGYLAYAHAVQLGRSGQAAQATEAAQRGDAHMARMPWYRNLVRRLAAEAAIADGWGEPTAWLTEAAEFFDAADNGRIASACRALLRRSGVRVARPTQATRALPEPLRRAGVTPREAEVLALVGEGLSNRAIAERLFLSERTVEQHVGWLKQKLAMRTRAQLAVFAAAEAGATG